MATERPRSDAIPVLHHAAHTSSPTECASGRAAGQHAGPSFEDGRLVQKSAVFLRPRISGSQIKCAYRGIPYDYEAYHSQRQGPVNL